MIFGVGLKKKKRLAGVRRHSGAGGGWRALHWRVALRGAVAAGALLAAAGGAWGFRAHLHRSERHTLKHIEIDSPGPMVTPELLREELGLREGENIFTVCDMARQRHGLSQKLHVAREITMTRVLPDRLVVRVVERTPVAEIHEPKREGAKPAGAGLFTDAEGMLFRGAWPARLPVIKGAEEQAEPGTRLRGLARMAAFLVTTHGDMGLDFQIAEVDVSPAHHFVLRVPNRPTRILFEWDGMDRPDEASAAELRRRLKDDVAPALRAGAAATQIDARFNDFNVTKF